MMRRITLGALALVCTLAWPGVAHAQSTIAGTVKDSSGLVLPGVNVEASSDALIEKVRSVVSDETGQYRIVDLRPGTYVVTFTLTGFNTVRREGVELGADFTASINAEMRIGSLSETITVQGSSPVVDVQSAARTQVLNRELLDAVPAGRSYQGYAQMVPGISLSSPDVGGEASMQNTYMSVHGASSANVSMLVDGQMINGLQGDGSVQTYFNNMMSEEMSFQTAGIGADVSGGGVKVNMIPQTGGNRFAGAFFSAWAPGDWQSNNLTDELRAQGLGDPSSILKLWDFNFSQGGPIKKDKLWFFFSVRHWGNYATVADTFYSNDYGKSFAPKSGELGVDDQYIRSGLLRLTWQMTPRMRISGYNDQVDKYRGHNMSAGTDPATAARNWYTPHYYTGAVKWTMTASDRLLFEAGYSTNVEIYTNHSVDPTIPKERGTPEWYATPVKTDLDLGTTWFAAADTSTGPERFAYAASMTYVTGTHNIKGGVQRTWGPFNHTEDRNADLIQRYRSGVPDSVTAYNTPRWWQERLNSDIGLYIQDSWTIKRLTLNPGLRWEYLNGQNTSTVSGAGRFVPERTTPVMENVPNWKDFAPRFGAVYDLFGNAKTALKMTYSRYNGANTTGFAANYNALASSATANLAWVDLNRDDVAQGNLGCAYLTAGCEINFGQLPIGFGSLTSLRRPDPNFARPYNVETSVAVQHELLPRVSLNASWYHRVFHNLTVTDYTNRTPSDYTPVNVVSPLDGEVITVYNISPSALVQIDRVDFASSERQQIYDGYEFSLSARLPGGAQIFGGTVTQHTLNVNCDQADDPNQFRFCDERERPNPFRTQIKMSGAYTLPKLDIQTSASFQSEPGFGLLTNWNIGRTTRYAADCKGPCTPGALVIPNLTDTALVVPLIPSGYEFVGALNQFDVKLAKLFTVRGVRLTGQFEMFNSLNASAVLALRGSQTTQNALCSQCAPSNPTGTYIGTPLYHQPGDIVQGRLYKIGLQVRW
jgi:Carboxypeptidase regulatory-like domain